MAETTGLLGSTCRQPVPRVRISSSPPKESPANRRLQDFYFRTICHYRIMGNRLLDIVRISAMMLLVAGVYGYLCYEKTRIAGWLPSPLPSAEAVVTMPLLSRQWNQRRVRRPGHKPVVPPVPVRTALYFPPHGRQLPAGRPGVGYGEQITVMEKIHKCAATVTAWTPFGAGAGLDVFLPADLAFADGMRRKDAGYRGPQLLPGGLPETVTMRRRFFGFPVIGRFGAPTNNSSVNPAAIHSIRSGVSSNGATSCGAGGGVRSSAGEWPAPEIILPQSWNTCR